MCYRKIHLYICDDSMEYGDYGTYKTKFSDEEIKEKFKEIYNDSEIFLSIGDVIDILISKGYLVRMRYSIDNLEIAAGDCES